MIMIVKLQIMIPWTRLNHGYCVVVLSIAVVGN